MGTYRKPRLAIVVSHPIQHFAPWHREAAKRSDLTIRVFFCRNWGAETYHDKGFGMRFRWDTPLLEGYDYEFVPPVGKVDVSGPLGVDNPEISATLTRFSPDVVKIFGYTLKTNWRAALWARCNHKPLLIYSDSNMKAQTFILKKAAKQIIVRAFYRSFVDGALYIGDNNRGYHQHYGVPTERLYRGVIPVDRERLLRGLTDRAAIRSGIRKKYGIPDSAFLVLFCGKYVERKRPLDVVQAVHQLVQRNIPVRGLLVGEGRERARLEKWIQANNSASVVLTGFVNQAAIPEYYAAADALVVSSSADPHPLVVTEAACFGLPIIASDQIGCIGPSDTAQPGVNALVYSCGKSAELASRIQQLWEDQALYYRMAEQSTRIAGEQDAKAAATCLVSAVLKLREIGPRSRWSLSPLFPVQQA